MFFDLDLFSTLYFIPKKLFREKFRRFGSELGGELLDIGCGIRAYKDYTNSTVYVGLDNNADVSPDVVADAVRLPFREESFESIICTEVLEHLGEPERAIIEIRKVLKNGGKGIITAPMSWNLHYEPYDFYRFTKYGLQHLLTKNGFRIIAIERIGGCFSLIGSRLVEVLSKSALSMLFFIPYKVRRVIIGGLIAVPLSLVSYLLSKYLDNLDNTDAIAWFFVVEKVKGKLTE